jgi:ATP-dependent exoDNAse (exonuclease V) beta subunit
MKSVEKTETFKMLKLFLTQVSYDVKETDEKDQLTLSTIHQSKGLEWPIGTLNSLEISPIDIFAVFLVHVNEGYLPSKHFGEKIAMKSSQEGVSKSIGEDEYTMIEEERRLCYVAMTRAEQQLIISTFAEEKGIKSVSSRFLEEISKEQCDTVNKIPKEKSSVQIKQKNSTMNVNSSNKSSFQIKRIEVEQSQLPPMLRPQNVSPKKAANTIAPKKNSPQKRKSPTTTVQSPTSHLPSQQKKLKQTESAKKKIDFSRHSEFTSAREVSEEDSSTDNYFEGEDKDPDEIKDDDEEDEGNTEKQNESGPTIDDLAALIESEDSASSVTLQQSSKKSQSPVKEVPGPVGLSKLMDVRVRSPGLRRTNKRRRSTGTAADVLPANELESPLKKQKTSLGHSTNVNKDR